jgi:uncharacterized protein YeeX (DUF496 family)
MNDKISGYYECSLCSKNYKVKKSYDKHLLLCNVISKSIRERKADNEISENIPSMREMYNIIQILILKNDRLEKQVEKMSTWIHNNKKKVNILEWLNENNRPPITFDVWLERVEINKEDMECVITHNFIEGIHMIVKRLIHTNYGENESQNDIDQSKCTEKIPLDEYEYLPIKAFEQKENILYVFNGTEWNIINHEQYTKLLNKLTKGLISQLKLWQDEHKNKLFERGFSEKYIEYVKKLTGGDLSLEQQSYKIKQSFYNHLKVNIKNIIQYEFVF